jgi:hypothetical protein
MATTSQDVTFKRFKKNVVSEQLEGREDEEVGKCWQ